MHRGDAVPFGFPAALEDDGGWLKRDTVDAFAEYAAPVAARYADRVAHWLPHNEPNVATFHGYQLGMFAPGRDLMFEACPVAHHLLAAHGLAAAELRRPGEDRRQRAEPHTDVAGERQRRTRDHQAVRRARQLAVHRADAAGPLPRDILPLVEHADRTATRTIRQPSTLGVNDYNPVRVAANLDEEDENPFEFRRPGGLATRPTSAGPSSRTRCGSG